MEFISLHKKSYGQYIILLADLGKDHGCLCEIMKFEKCSREECQYIIIIDDDMVERDETFHVTLERTPGLDKSIKLDPTEKRVKIISDDGEWMGMVGGGGDVKGRG